MKDRNERKWRRSAEESDSQNRNETQDRRPEAGSHGPRRPDRRPTAPNLVGGTNYWASQGAGINSGPYTGYGPRGYRRSDDRILEDIRDRLTQHAEINADDIEVKVESGTVTLTGTVEDRRGKRLVEANVEMIPGVVDVVNELRLQNAPTREELAAERAAKEMAEKFPGGPTPTGNAGY